MTRYAETTSVTSDKSRAEIERTLSRYGATSFMYGWDQQAAIVGFVADDRQVRFTLPMPDKAAREFTHTPSKNLRRSADQVEAAYEQAVRQRWRALALVIKAKLEAVQAGIVTFEEEFLAHILLPSGDTVGEWITPQLEETYEHATMPEVLPGQRLHLTAGDAS